MIDVTVDFAEDFDLAFTVTPRAKDTSDNSKRHISFGCTYLFRLLYCIVMMHYENIGIVYIIILFPFLWIVSVHVVASFSLVLFLHYFYYLLSCVVSFCASVEGLSFRAPIRVVILVSLWSFHGIGRPPVWIDTGT